MTIHVLLAEGRVNPMGKGICFFKWSALLEAAISKPIEGVELCAFEAQLLFYSESSLSSGQGIMAHGQECFLLCVREIETPTVKVMA